MNELVLYSSSRQIKKKPQFLKPNIGAGLSTHYHSVCIEGEVSRMISVLVDHNAAHARTVKGSTDLAIRSFIVML